MIFRRHNQRTLKKLNKPQNLIYVINMKPDLSYPFFFVIAEPQRETDKAVRLAST